MRMRKITRKTLRIHSQKRKNDSLVIKKVIFWLWIRRRESKKEILTFQESSRWEKTHAKNSLQCASVLFVRGMWMRCDHPTWSRYHEIPSYSYVPTLSSLSLFFLPVWLYIGEECVLLLLLLLMMTLIVYHVHTYFFQ